MEIRKTGKLSRNMFPGELNIMSKSQSGAVLMYIVGTMVILGVLGAAMVSFFGAGITQTASPNCRERARFVAEGGLRYAVSQLNATNGNQVNGSYAISNGTFNLEISNASADVNEQIWNATVTGHACLGTSGSSNYILNAMVKFTNGNVNGTDGNELASKSPISLPHRAHVSGDVTSSDSVTLENDSVVDGDVTSGSDTLLKHRVKVYGSVCSNGNLELQQDAEIFGNATAHGYAILNQRSKIYGDLVASDYVELKKNAEVAGNIDAGEMVTIVEGAEVGGQIVSGNDVQIDGLVRDDVYSYGNIIVGNKGEVQGSVYSAGYVSHPGAVEGSIYEGMDPDDLPDVSKPKNCTSEVMFPELNENCTGGGEDVPVDKHDNITLSPGTYGNISAKGKNTITLHDGVDYYCVDSLDIGNDSVLRLDLSGGEEEGITFFSAGDIDLQQRVNIQVSEDGNNYTDIENADEQLAKRVYFEAHEDVTIGNNGKFFGTLLVGGSLDVGQNGAVVIGAFYVLGDSVDLGIDIDMTYVPSNYASEHWYK